MISKINFRIYHFCTWIMGSLTFMNYNFIQINFSACMNTFQWTMDCSNHKLKRWAFCARIWNIYTTLHNFGLTYVFFHLNLCIFVKFREKIGFTHDKLWQKASRSKLEFFRKNSQNLHMADEWKILVFLLYFSTRNFHLSTG